MTAFFTNASAFLNCGISKILQQLTVLAFRAESTYSITLCYKQVHSRKYPYSLDTRYNVRRNERCIFVALVASTAARKPI